LTPQSSDYATSKTGTRSPHDKGVNNDAVGLDNNNNNDNDRDNDFKNSN